MECDRTEVLPPLDELRLPGLQCPLQPPVAGQVDVVGNEGVVVDGGHWFTLGSGRSRDGSRCRTGGGRRRARGRSAVGTPSSPKPRDGRRSWSRRSRGGRSGGWPPWR